MKEGRDCLPKGMLRDRPICGGLAMTELQRSGAWRRRCVIFALRAGDVEVEGSEPLVVGGIDVT